MNSRILIFSFFVILGAANSISASEVLVLRVEGLT